MKILKKLYNWFTKKMEPDPEKIKAILADLKEKSGQEWNEVLGFHITPAADSQGVSLSINLNSGMIQKAFINLTTGEVRYFWVNKLSKD